jgi:hypothetical protein
MAETDQVLKVDVAGRVWTPRARREEVLDEFERSGMAAAKFAAFVGLLGNCFRARRTGNGQNGTGVGE